MPPAASGATDPGRSAQPAHGAANGNGIDPQARDELAPAAGSRKRARRRPARPGEAVRRTSRAPDVDHSGPDRPRKDRPRETPQEGQETPADDSPRPSEGPRRAQATAEAALPAQPRQAPDVWTPGNNQRPGETNTAQADAIPEDLDEIEARRRPSPPPRSAPPEPKTGRFRPCSQVPDFAPDPDEKEPAGCPVRPV